MLVTITTPDDEVQLEAVIVDVSRSNPRPKPNRFAFLDGPRVLDLKLISACDRIRALVGQHPWISVIRGRRPPVWFDGAELALVGEDHAVVSGGRFDAASVTPAVPARGSVPAA